MNGAAQLCDAARAPLAAARFEAESVRDNGVAVQACAKQAKSTALMAAARSGCEPSVAPAN